MSMSLQIIYLNYLTFKMNTKKRLLLLCLNIFVVLWYLLLDLKIQKCFLVFSSVMNN